MCRIRMQLQQTRVSAGLEAILFVGEPSVLYGRGSEFTKG